MSDVSLLYPAYQKLYSALNNLDKFRKENDFFDNISSLDTFFSEFRNITFVLQKSLKHTDYFSAYERLRDQYLMGCRWLVTKRNETTKHQPFQLLKRVDVTIYSQVGKVLATQHSFTVENDVEISSLLDSLKEIFLSINDIAVFFSGEFTFYEDGDNVDIYEKITSGINSMLSFLQALSQEINTPCKLCESIAKKVRNLYIVVLPRDLFLVSDYVYVPRNDSFEKAELTALMLGDTKKAMPRMSIDAFSKGVFRTFDGSLFEKFVFLHVIQKNIDILPATMIVYLDGTFELDAYGSNIKTTGYRKIKEVADKILQGTVKEVYFMQAYVGYSNDPNLLLLTIQERAKTKVSHEMLVFMKVDQDLHVAEHAFDSECFRCEAALAHQIRSGMKNELVFGSLNMIPIIDAFEQQKKEV